MRHGLLVALLIVAAGGGCNSTPAAGPGAGGHGGSSAGNGGGVAGTSGNAGGSGAGAGADSGVCANLACLQTLSDLVIGCTGGGACVYQSDFSSTPMTETKCFDNGVKVLMTIQSSSGPTTSTATQTFKVEKNGALCFSKNAVSSAPTGAEAGTDITGDVTTTDASGALVAIVHTDPNGVVTVACPGSPPTVLDDSCGFSRLIIGAAYLTDSSALCTMGACSF